MNVSLLEVKKAFLVKMEAINMMPSLKDLLKTISGSTAMRITEIYSYVFQFVLKKSIPVECLKRGRAKHYEVS